MQALASLGHDPADRLKAMALASEYGEKLYTGVFYRNPEPPPTYEAEARRRQEEATGPGPPEGAHPRDVPPAVAAGPRHDRPPPDRPRGHGRPRLHAAGRGGDDRGPREERGADRDAPHDPRRAQLLHLRHPRQRTAGRKPAHPAGDVAPRGAPPAARRARGDDGGQPRLHDAAGAAQRAAQAPDEALRRHRGDAGRRGRERPRLPGAEQAHRPLPHPGGGRAAPRPAGLEGEGGRGAGLAAPRALAPAPARHPAPHDPGRRAAGTHRGGLRRGGHPGEAAAGRPVRRARGGDRQGPDLERPRHGRGGRAAGDPHRRPAGLRQATARRSSARWGR